MIIKRRYTANFTTIGNRLFEDDRLAADEVGILAYLRSRPHDWEVRRPALQRRWDMGRDAIKRVITSLVRTGWCIARKERLPNGTFCMIYEIRDEPGPTLTDDEVRRALSLVSSEAVSDEVEVVAGPEDRFVPSEPPTGYPSLADPSLADPYVAYIDIQKKELPRTDSTQKFEREGARAREKHAVNLAEFKRRWPSSAGDDPAKVDKAWFDLSSEEGQAAIDNIVPFLDNQKKLGRKYPLAGFTYLGQKRWTLLTTQAVAGKPVSSAYGPDSLEAKAITVLHRIAGSSDFLRSVMRAPDGSVRHLKPVTPRLVALSQAMPREEWVELNHKQAGAWEAFVDENLTLATRRHLVEGALAPWPWPPNKEGGIYTVDHDTEAQLGDERGHAHSEGTTDA